MQPLEPRPGRDQPSVQQLRQLRLGPELALVVRAPSFLSCRESADELPRRGRWPSIGQSSRRAAIFRWRQVSRRRRLKSASGRRTRPTLRSQLVQARARSACSTSRRLPPLRPGPRDLSWPLWPTIPTIPDPICRPIRRPPTDQNLQRRPHPRKKSPLHRQDFSVHRTRQARIHDQIAGNTTSPPSTNLFRIGKRTRPEPDEDTVKSV